jgi:hypothetical protein
MSRRVDLLELSEDALQLLGRNPTTSIADHDLNRDVPFSAKSIRFVKYVCRHRDGPLCGVLDGICSEVGDGGLDLPRVPNDVSRDISRVDFEFQFAPDCLQPGQELAMPGIFKLFGTH